MKQKREPYPGAMTFDIIKFRFIWAARRKEIMQIAA
jgi:hypothetical protein